MTDYFKETTDAYFQDIPYVAQSYNQKDFKSNHPLVVKDLHSKKGVNDFKIQIEKKLNVILSEMHDINKIKKRFTEELTLYTSRKHNLEDTRESLKKETKELENETSSLISKLEEIRKDHKEIKKQLEKERNELKESTITLRELELIKNKLKDQVKECINDYVINGSIKDTISNIMTIKKKEDQLSCSICFDNERNCVILDCNHFAICEKCSQKVKKCPICRIDIKKGIKKVFFS